MRKFRIVLCLIAVVASTGAKRRSIDFTTPRDLTIERSFAVTEPSILAPFTLERVLRTLIANSRAPQTSPETFFRQMFDTQNPKPGLDATMPHCDDELLDGRAAHNGFRRRCPTEDGAFLATSRFRPEEFLPLALINRFDMADAGGTTCGQYRIIFGRATRDVLNIIFEGGLRNPHPENGLAACRAVAQFWADLSAMPSVAQRRALLERFFFEGIDGFAPVLDPDHFRDAPHGIRTMQWIIQASPVHFYQFRLVNECQGSTCRLFAKPDGLENMPSSRFLDATDRSDRATRFRAHFLEQIPNLAIPDLDAYFMTTPGEFLVAENESNDDGIGHAALVSSFSRNLRTPEGNAFWNQIHDALRQAGSNMMPEQVLTRAAKLNCEGCHIAQNPVPIGDGILFPASSPLSQHVSRTKFEKGDEGPSSRYAISPAMRDVFIPHRMRILIDFLKSGKTPERAR